MPTLVTVHAPAARRAVVELQPFFALASSSLMPFMSLHVPLATYFHSPGSLSTLFWPAQVCVPDRLAQSFWPALAMPKHFSFSLACAAAWPARPSASTEARAEETI